MENQLFCDHCGDEITGINKHKLGDKSFCCNGCLLVYQLLSENNLGNFYEIEQKSGVKPKIGQKYKYDFLEVPDIRQKFVDFEDDKYVKITLYLPTIHCSSCIYLLENLTKILPAVTLSQVNFIKKEALITFKKEELSLAELARFLEKIGYSPNFGNRKLEAKKSNRRFFYKLGVAGFAFGSIMLWSVPDYTGKGIEDADFKFFTSILTFIVSIPVLLFSANGYFISAYKALRSKSLNLDVPIAIGITALYLQSTYSIFVEGNSGYMDSFAGFIFFLLIGKWFQNQTYSSMSFERDYTAYFPVAVTRISDDKSEEIVEIEKINAGDTILLRNEEVLPCDSILKSKTAKIDYSFVTGESEPVTKQKGDFIYAGGKLIGQKITLTTEHTADRSLLTQLWDEVKTNKKKSDRYKFQDIVAKYFLIVVLVVAALSAITWAFIDPTRITEIIVSVLIVACPCALALSSPFTFGNTMKLMGRKGLFLKNSAVVERMEEITDVVFDKTGTLTDTTRLQVIHEGEELTLEEKTMIYSLANSSTHPLSRAIVNFYKEQGISGDIELEDFVEKSGRGLKGKNKDIIILLGSHSFINCNRIESGETETYYRINNKAGRFIFKSELRTQIQQMISELDDYEVHILSGDKNTDEELMKRLLKDAKNLHFEQKPTDKYNYINELQQQGKNVLMVGDGLNDSGALEIAHVGIAVSEDIFRFTPSSDAIIEANKLQKLNVFLDFSKYARKVLKINMIFSISYNFIGLLFAVLGYLTPLVAAILMPLSSITIVALSAGLVYRKKI